ncbi:MAG TPA: tetratricopeptide repeat protein [Anaerolineae bacterium]|nr:tetratricopeptide repeat protein [Anaerolineae bacterium]
MGPLLTIREKATRLRQIKFTGRDDDLDLFRSMLPLAQRTKGNLLVIYGIGGIGKSVLLGEFQRICAEMDVPVAIVDGQDHRSILSILLEMKEQLSRTDKLVCSRFEEGMKRHQKIQDKLAGQGDIPQKVIGMLSRSLFHAAKAVPVAGSVAEVVGEENIRLAMDAVYSAVGRRDGEFFFQPEEELTNRLLIDLNEYAATRRLVLLFDTYEVMDGLDDWVRDSFIANLGEHALVVIAGRHKLEGKDWREYSPLMIQRKLSGLSETEAREYLRKRGVDDDTSARQMIAFAGGHPLTLTLLADLAANAEISDLSQVPDRRIIVKELIERIIGQVESDLRTALEVCGVLRYVTEESLSHLLERDEDEVSRLFATVRKLGFIKVRNGGLALHESVRVALDEDLQWRSPDRSRRLHARAAEFYAQRLATSSGEEQERCRLEHLYHQIRANEEEGMRLFQKRAEELVGYCLLNRLRPFLDEANGYPLKKANSRLWREYYNARLAHLEARLADAEVAYQAIAENEQSEPRLQAYALCDWGEVLSRYERLAQSGGFERAVSVLERSLSVAPLDSHLTRSYIYLAGVQGYEFRWDEQARLFAEAQDCFEKSGDSYGLAHLYIEMKKGAGARGSWRDLFSIQKELDGICELLPEHLALKSVVLWRWTWGEALAGRLCESEQKLKESIGLSRSLDDSFSLLSALRDLGWILGCQRQYKAANRKFKESLEIVERLGEDYIQDAGTGLGFWGAILTRQGEIDQATKCLLQALETKERLQDDRGILEQLVWLGRLYEIQQDLDEAQEYYERSLKMRWCGRNYFDTEALTGLARVKYARGDHDAVRALLAEADGLAKQYEYNDHLASLRLAEGHMAWSSQSVISVDEGRSGYEVVLAYYQQALVFALRYNRFLLDEILAGGNALTPLRPIIPFCLDRAEEGRRMLAALRDWWRVGLNDIGGPREDTISLTPEGISLLKAEHLARSRERGDGSAQRTVTEQIDAALNAASTG